MPYAIIEHACPNCGGFIDTERLSKGLPCRVCLNGLEHVKLDKLSLKENVYINLLTRKKLYGYKEILNIERSVKEFEAFFSKASGKKPWSAQRTWAKRLLKGESFAIIAPTGVGKTTFSIIYALYHAFKSKSRAYIIVPTKNLQDQVTKKALEFISKLGITLNICSPGIINEDLLETGNFQLLITTSAYLSKNFVKIGTYRFSLIIVDDVDALLRNSRNIDRILKLIGFSDRILEIAYKLIVSKIDFFKLVISGSDENKIARIREKIREYKAEIEKYVKETKLGQILVCSATGRSKGLKAKMFKELLKFEAGTVIEYMRNVVDTYMPLEKDYVKQIISLIKKLGNGGLIFVSQDLGVKEARRLVEKLRENSIKAELASSSRHGYIKRFVEGKTDILVGIANYYGVIVRGIDIPDRIRYAIFLGVPKFQIELEKGLNNPVKIIVLLTALEEAVENEDELKYIRKTINILSKSLDKISFKELKILRRAISENIELKGYLGKLLQIILEAKKFILNKISDSTIRDKLKKSQLLILREFKDKTYIVSPDVMTYIQASGRTSRMFANGMTKGLSIILVDDEKVFKKLIKQLRYYIDSFEIKKFDEINLSKILYEIDRDREVIRKILKGEIEAKYQDPIIPALFIVESPTKARTIAYFFGKPSKRRINGVVVYEVLVGDPKLGSKDYMLSIVATKGHILDLTTSSTMGYFGVLVDSDTIAPIYTTIKKCKECGHQYTLNSVICPKCGSTKIFDSKSIIDTLRKLAQEVDMVFIGTDPDSEGEKIAWDVMLLLKPYVKNIFRIEFHEITRKAIIKALANPRNINRFLVEAQVVRRVEDRWIGFELSRRLWGVFGKHWLSAGRVQTPVLGWIIKQHKKWKASRRLFAEYILEGGLKVRFDYDVYFDKSLIKEYVKNGALILIKTTFIEKINPPPPYTTNTLLSELTSKYRLDAQFAMRILQDLFESGFITYHRTDSTHVSNAGFEIAKEYVLNTLKYNDLIKLRSWGAEGTHECIRPTKPYDAETLKKLLLNGTLRTFANFTYSHFKVYDLIFRRFIASQMKPAIVEKVRLTVKIGESVKTVEFIGKVVEEGFLKVLPIQQVLNLNNVNKGSVIRIVDCKTWKGSLNPLYRQGDVIKLMKDKGIGRPSTYAKILSSILKHGYVIESKNKYLVPTTLGIKVYEYLSKNYGHLVSEETTRKLEETMDLIEKGKLNYIEVLRDLLTTLNKPYVRVHAEKAKVET